MISSPPPPAILSGFAYVIKNESCWRGEGGGIVKEEIQAQREDKDKCILKIK